MNQYFKFAVIIGLFAAASINSACSKRRIDTSSLSDELRRAPLEIDVFAARGFLGGSDYERYYLSKDLLWRECGHVSPAPKTSPRREHLEGDQALPDDPSLSLVERRVEKLSRDQELLLKVNAAELLKARAMSDEKEPLPGSLFSLSEPGTFEMGLVFGPSKLRLVTSVDAVADKDNAVLERANELLATLRGIGPVICESDTFFSVPRKQ